MELTKDILAELARPFTLAAVRYKVLTNPGSDSKAAAAFYIDARLVAERLNAVVGPEGWSDAYRIIWEAQPQAAAAAHFPVECTLSVLGCTKVDVGVYQRASADDLAIKSAYSDAFKRSAVKFRVGAYLYAIPRLRVEVRVDNGKAKGFTNAGEDLLKRAYSKWIADPKLNPFGEALDHGDTIDEAGVSEVE